jgi:hypothetical protein
MSIATLRAYLSAHLATIDASLHQHIAAFVEFVEGKEAEAKAEADKIAAEIAHLTAAGYTVVKAAEAVLQA